jgi:SAM-dependent methyltransferase
MQPEKSMKDYYAARAHEFDRVYAKPERQNDLRHLKNWLPAAFSHRRVLEVACGTGYWTQFIATKAAHVVATDATQETLDIAQKRITARNVDFHIADAYALPDRLGHSKIIHALPINRPQLRGRLELAWNPEEPISPAARALIAHARKRFPAQW